MRITLTIDSATPDEASAFVRALQRTDDFARPVTLTNGDCTVSIIGIGWTVTTPPLYVSHAMALLDDFVRITEPAEHTDD